MGQLAWARGVPVWRAVGVACGVLALAALGGCGGAGADPAEAGSSSAGGESYTAGESRGGEAASGHSATGSSESSGGASDNQEFALRASDTAGEAHGATPSEIKATRTEAAMKFVVVDKEKGPVKGVVIRMTAPSGDQYHTKETDETGYAEVLVPVGKKYKLAYLSLGRNDVVASVPVSDEPNQNIKLTLRYKGRPPPVPHGGFVLDGIRFDVNKATIRRESYPRLDFVVEYMQYKPSVRLQIAGHTDNAGNPKANKDLSLRRARACRKYLVDQGIDGGRIDAVGYGEERPVASNDTEEGRQHNRRIEARELE